MTNTEYHPAWLATMGVAQWQLRNAVTNKQEWPAHMLNVAYWLTGAPLDNASEPLLHAIMGAIGVDMANVVYCSDDAILNIPLPTSATVMHFGHVANAWQSPQALVLPSLHDMLAQPERKREAWTVLKSFCA